MRLDIAQGVGVGDVVYNCFMDPLKVKEKILFSADTYPSYRHMEIIVTDSNNAIHKYLCEDLYLSDLEDEDDAEKSWINWAKNNKDFFDTFDHINTIKEIYKTAFYNGFEYKKQLTHEEIMQK